MQIPLDAGASRVLETGWSHGERREASARLPETREPHADEALAFLASSGATPAEIAAAAARARCERISLIDAFLSAEDCDEDKFYRRLARHLGLRYVENRPELKIDNFEVVLAAGMAEIASSSALPSWLTAPSGRQVEALLSGRRPAIASGCRFFLTSPKLYRQFVLEAAASVIANKASTLLKRYEPGLSAAYATRFPTVLLAVGAAAVTLGCFEPMASWIVGSLPFFVAASLRLCATIASLRPRSAEAPALADEDLPTYTVLAPLYREPKMVPKLLKHLAAIDYPRAKLDIKVILEQDDCITREACALFMPPWIEILVAPKGCPHTKPRALNVALPFARGSLLVVYDAEDEPASAQLREAAARFAAAPSDLACLQAALAIHNAGDAPVAALFAMEYAALFDVQLKGLAAMNAPLPLGGTSNHFRIEALRRVWGWDAWNVTEDIDLGLRLARFGYRADVLESTTLEEAPNTLAAWLGQRRRWLKGWMVTLLVLCSDPRRMLSELGALRAAYALCLVAAPLAGFLIMPFAAVRIIWGLCARSLFDLSAFSGRAKFIAILVLLAIGAVSILWPLVLGMKRRRILALTGYVPILPFYYALLSWACWLALRDLLKDPFYWEKTEHGLAKSAQQDGDD